MALRKPVRALFFDLDETLLDDNSSYEASIARVCNDLASGFPSFNLGQLKEAYRIHSDMYWGEVGGAVVSGAIDGQTVRRESWRRALRSCGCDDDALADAALMAYSRHRRDTYSLFEDASAILRSLHGRLPLALITNGSSDTQWEKARCTSLDTMLQEVVVSGEVGVAKPDAAIFHHVLDRLDVPAESVWHVGDNLHADVGGAKVASLGGAVWLNRGGVRRSPDDPEPDLEIASLTELLAHLD